MEIVCRGGVNGPRVSVPAALAFLKRESEAELILVGREEAIRAELQRRGALHHARLSIVHASEVVEMDDPLQVALRRKKDSSMRVAIDLVKQGQAQACVSAGNTGALMAVSSYLLKTLPGVDRPSICTILPNTNVCPNYMFALGEHVYA